MPEPAAGGSRLDGRTALVTGCSPGLNAGIAQIFAERGAAVACMDLNPSYSHACAAWLRGAGARAIALTGDVTSEADVERCVGQVDDELGGLDILVNGAAIESWQGLLQSSVDDFRRHLDVIVSGAFLMSQYAAKSMIRRKVSGSILNLGSTEAHQGRPGNLGYGVSKAAILHLTKCLAMELAEFGIRVNSITPTGTDPTESDQRREEWGVEWNAPKAPRRPDFSSGSEGIPLGHRPAPSDYGRAAAFLASDDAAAITGVDLRVDGGVVSRYWRWNPANPESTPPSQNQEQP